MLLERHGALERNSVRFLIAMVIATSLGGLFEIGPLFTIDSTVEEVEGMRPYTPLELAGRNVYIREGCYGCHSQMIRTLRDDVERYGHYSLAAESQYDHPMLWGSKRTGPDLARVGGKYSDEWHREHLIAPRVIVAGSVMPGYAFLTEHSLHVDKLHHDLLALRRAGVPYTDEMIENAAQDARAQAVEDSDDADALIERYGEKVSVRNFDGDPDRITEMDALIAYLQMLGTLANLKDYKASGRNLR